MEKIRLQKIFTDAGIMSRRAAEKEISDGKVTVNGVTASLGDKADVENDIILYNGKRIGAAPKRHHTYIMLNKPMGYVTTMSDEQGRKNVTELTAEAGVRIYPVGRLDMYSEGLLIMTDDGELTNKLTHPSHSIGKVYLVKVKGRLGDDAVRALKAPMELDGYRLQPVEVRLVASGKEDREKNVYSVLEITLFEGRNRQIRKMCQICGITVMRLKRIKIGELSLGELSTGKWRHLTEDEVAYLKNS